MTGQEDRARLMAALMQAACAAGDVVWRHFTDGCVAEQKADLSPVTIADREAEAVILAALAVAAPGVAVVAEEECAAGRLPEPASRFFLVDPLDGTKEFVRRGTDFTVNIGLVENGVPVLGVVHAPALDTIWWGDAAGAFAATRAPGGAIGPARAIRVRDHGERAPVAVASKSHNTPGTDAWLAQAGAAERVSIGSSLKFLLVAEGRADVYPRCGPTMEWDTAAGDAILRAAGGRTLDGDGHPFRYGKPGYRNACFVATASYEPPLVGPYS